MSVNEHEQTLVLIKPDAIKNSLTGYVLSILSEFHTGLRFAGLKVVHVPLLLAQEHYAEHKGKVFYPSLLEYIMGKLHYPANSEKQRVIAIVYQGDNAILKLRDFAGPTNPLQAREKRPGCIRSLGTLVPIFNEKGEEVGDRMDNLIHASANVVDAQREIKLWFAPRDLPPAMQAFPTRQCNEHYYFKGSKLFTAHESESVCIMAPGDIAWSSDLDALEAIAAGREVSCSLESVAAKYLINERREN